MAVESAGNAKAVRMRRVRAGVAAVCCVLLSMTATAAAGERPSLVLAQYQVLDPSGSAPQTTMPEPEVPAESAAEPQQHEGDDAPEPDVRPEPETAPLQQTDAEVELQPEVPEAGSQVETSETEPDAIAPAGETDSAVDPAYRFSALRSASGQLEFRGHVPDIATRTMLRRLVAAPAELNEIAIRPGAPEGFARDLAAGLAALERLETGQVAYARGLWLLSGYAEVDTRKAQAVDLLAQLGGDETPWRVMITAPAARTVCEAEITAFMESRSILFASGSARLTPESLALLPELAEKMNICPQTPVYIEGHTDSDGGDALNLLLSAARAEAVVDALIGLGVSARRLYAVGYGASLPVASNATAAGKRENRRIVFAFEDAAD